MSCCDKDNSAVIEVLIDDTLKNILKRALDYKKEFGVMPTIKVYNKQTLLSEVTPEELVYFLAERGDKPIKSILDQEKI